MRVRRDWEAPLPSLRGDASRVQALLETLLDDVARDCGERSSMLVRVVRDATGVRMEVHDDGSSAGSRAETPAGDLRMEVAFEVVRRHGGRLERLPASPGQRSGWALELPTA